MTPSKATITSRRVPPGKPPLSRLRTCVRPLRAACLGLALGAPALAAAECLPPEVTGFATDHVRVLQDGEYTLHAVVELSPPECVVAVDDPQNLLKVRLRDGQRVWVPATDLQLSARTTGDRLRALGGRDTAADHNRAPENQAGVKAIGDEIELEEP